MNRTAAVRHSLLLHQQMDRPMINPHTQDWFVSVINDIPPPDDTDDELTDIIEHVAAQMRAMTEETEQ